MKASSTKKKSGGKSSRGTWTDAEDEALTQAVQTYGAKNWKKIAECVPQRSDVQCLHRWQKVLNPDLIKGPWTEEEDNKVRELVTVHGPKKWSLIASYLPGRIGKQCRERWTNHLDPDIKKGNWEPWEDELIIKLQKEHGNKWAKIAKHLPGRTDNAVKNRFNSTITRRLRQGKNQSGKDTKKTKTKQVKKEPLTINTQAINVENRVKKEVLPVITKPTANNQKTKTKSSYKKNTESFEEEFEDDEEYDDENILDEEWCGDSEELEDDEDYQEEWIGSPKEDNEENSLKENRKPKKVAEVGNKGKQIGKSLAQSKIAQEHPLRARKTPKEVEPVPDNQLPKPSPEAFQQLTDNQDNPALFSTPPRHTLAPSASVLFSPGLTNDFLLGDFSDFQSPSAILSYPFSPVRSNFSPSESSAFTPTKLRNTPLKKRDLPNSFASPIPKKPRGLNAMTPTSPRYRFSPSAFLNSPSLDNSTHSDLFSSPFDRARVRRQINLDDIPIYGTGDDLLGNQNLDIVFGSFPDMENEETQLSPRNRGTSSTIESPLTSPSPQRFKGINSFTIGSETRDKLKHINSKLNSDSSACEPSISVTDDEVFSPLKSPTFSRVLRYRDQNQTSENKAKTQGRQKKIVSHHEKQKENYPPPLKSTKNMYL